MNNSMDALHEAAADMTISFAPHLHLMAYEQSLELVEKIEARLAKHGRSLPKLIYKNAIVPLTLIVRGAQSMFAEAINLFVASLTLLFLTAVALELVPNVHHNILLIVSVLALLLTVMMIIFPAPSVYCSEGINSKYISTVHNQLSQWNEMSIKRIELIAKNVKIFEERTQRRLVVFRWLLAAAWALITIFTTELVKSLATVPPRIVDITPLLPSLIFVGIIFLIVEIYARGHDIVYRSIELGCNEAIAQIDRHESRQAQKNST